MHRHCRCRQKVTHWTDIAISSISSVSLETPFWREIIRDPGPGAMGTARRLSRSSTMDTQTKSSSETTPRQTHRSSIADRSTELRTMSDANYTIEVSRERESKNVWRAVPWGTFVSTRAPLPFDLHIYPTSCCSLPRAAAVLAKSARTLLPRRRFAWART